MKLQQTMLDEPFQLSINLEYFVALKQITVMVNLADN